MKKVEVALENRSYDILIDENLISKFPVYLEGLLNRKFLAIVTDTNVENLHLSRLLTTLENAGIKTKVLSIKAGESSKSWETLQATVDWMLDNKIERNDLVVAFGGGVVGDLVGFAAAIMRRGIQFIQCPTSLLAQVDSSVGGKTGINTSHGKNLVGAFYQPSLVISDISTLKTLEERDFLAGYGEVAKYGLLGDYEFYCWLEENVENIKNRDIHALIKAVAHSCEMKSAIVIADEKEQGERALLNLGHTFCHALEAATGYSDRMLHGEGVAIGSVLAFDLSAKMGLTSQEDPTRIKKHFEDMGMMNSINNISGTLPNADKLVELMFQDKKVVNGKLNLILAKGIGEAFIARDVDPNLIKDVHDFYGKRYPAISFKTNC
ncbi:MAG: 3-dehydroquinate synthase [Rhodobacterales bacterium]|nr:3-dehydroquinate synthase [Rhodobacterales bacterium]